MERTILPRSKGVVETSFGTISVKTVDLPDGRKRTYPEHDDVVRAAKEKNLPVADVWDEALRTINK